MMENSRAHNLVKVRLQLVYLLDGKLVDLEIVQVVFSLELLGVTYTRCTKVDAGNQGRWPTQGMLGRLRCPAACNEDGMIFPIGSGRPKQMIVRAASLLILPEPPVSLETIDRPRIRIAVVEVSDLVRHTS